MIVVVVQMLEVDRTTWPDCKCLKQFSYETLPFFLRFAWFLHRDQTFIWFYLFTRLCVISCVTGITMVFVSRSTYVCYFLETETKSKRSLSLRRFSLHGVSPANEETLITYFKKCKCAHSFTCMQSVSTMPSLARTNMFCFPRLVI